MVFGIRAEKDKLSVVIIDGTKEIPSFKDTNRLQVIINIPKNIEDRGEALNSIKREFQELLEKYKPEIVAMKDAETSQHCKVGPNILRGEVEGIVQLICYEHGIKVEKLLYTQVKSKLDLTNKSKEYLYDEVIAKFDLESLDDKHKDALLCAWAVLDE